MAKRVRDDAQITDAEDALQEREAREACAVEWLTQNMNSDDRVMLWMLSRAPLEVNGECYPPLLFRDHQLVASQYYQHRFSEGYVTLTSPQTGEPYPKAAVDIFARAALHHLSVIFDFSANVTTDELDYEIGSNLTILTDLANHTELFKPYVINAVVRNVAKMTLEEMNAFKENAKEWADFPDDSFERALLKHIDGFHKFSCLCKNGKPHNFKFSMGTRYCTVCGFDKLPNPNAPAFHWTNQPFPDEEEEDERPNYMFGVDRTMNQYLEGEEEEEQEEIPRYR